MSLLLRKYNKGYEVSYLNTGAIVYFTIDRTSGSGIVEAGLNGIIDTVEAVVGLDGSANLAGSIGLDTV